MINLNEKNHVVWIQTAFIGDIVLTTGALRLLKSQFPHIRQTVITTALGKDLLQGESFVDDVLVMKKKGLGFIRQMNAELKELDFDPTKSVVVQAHRSVRSSLLALSLKASRVCFSGSFLSSWSSFSVNRIPVFHESIRISLLLEAFGLERQEILLAKPVLNEITTEISDQLNAEVKPLIGVACGSVWATKRWLPEYFSELLILLVRAGYHPVLLGSPQERELVGDILEKSKCCDSVTNLAGRTTLKQLKSVYPKLQALISNDSSPTHFASAFHVPTLAIFGATTSAMGFGPVAKDSEVIEIQNLECRPCSDHGPKVCPLKHFQCMKLIKPFMVFERFQNIMSKIKKSSHISEDLPCS